MLGREDWGSLEEAELKLRSPRSRVGRNAQHGCGMYAVLGTKGPWAAVSVWLGVRRLRSRVELPSRERAQVRVEWLWGKGLEVDRLGAEGNKCHQGCGATDQRSNGLGVGS